MVDSFTKRRYNIRMELKTSLEYDAVEHEIMQTLVTIKNHSNRMQALKLLKNIREMNTKLSQYEVEDRRLHNKNGIKTREQVLRINNELENIRQWITLLLLM
jgi:hypothetical protein